MNKTDLMRVSREFKKEVERISEEEGKTMIEVTREIERTLKQKKKDPKDPLLLGW